MRPSVLYVTVPSLPRGSLVEIEPVCLDVDALAVIRRLASEWGGGGGWGSPEPRGARHGGAGYRGRGVARRASSWAALRFGFPVRSATAPTAPAALP